ncbi:MAG: exodeoxyribonuclease VII large subunit [Verrucomicrobia bacterium]|nr:exodeoxyribonuclease VII large subunit [Verrucomicrobiota bacterium]
MKILTITELTAAIKSILEPPFRGISVQGEISNFKLQTSGHLYFNLKDAGAQISAVLFKGNAAQLPRMPKEGDQVIAKGELSIYAPRGNYQLVIRELQFLGVGELLMKLHQLKEKLERQGWFDPKRKKLLPKLPKRIGVVTSPTGAVIQDILNILTRRFSGFHVILNPVKVQGEGAAAEIAQAIADFNKHQLADVLIVGRGGGSIEDLWAFNEEIVAKAIYESRIPIISAVGHETDFTIADWVADVRAPTPSAAAEIVIAEKANLLKYLAHAESVCRQRVLHQISQNRSRLGALKKHPFFSSPYTLLAQPIQQIDTIRTDLDGALQRLLEQQKAKLLSFSRQLELSRPSNRIAQMKERLASLRDQIGTALKNQISLKKGKFNADAWRETSERFLRQQILLRQEKLKRVSEHLRSLNPDRLLQKGYAILFAEKEDSIILSAKDLTPQKQFHIRLHDGHVTATANKVVLHDS